MTEPTESTTPPAGARPGSGQDVEAPSTEQEPVALEVAEVPAPEEAGQVPPPDTEQPENGPGDEAAPTPASEASDTETTQTPGAEVPGAEVPGEEAGRGDATDAAGTGQSSTRAAERSGPSARSRPGAPGPRPRAMPGPPSRPRSGGPREGRPLPRPPQVAAGAPAPLVHDAQDAAHAAAWGRVDEDGTVWVREASGERSVGQYPGADAEEALALYVVRFLDLQAQVALLEARLGQLAAKEVDQSITSLQAALKEPAAVGDLDALRARLATVAAAAQERRAAAAAEREAARAEALAARTAVVEQAEELAQADPSRTQWRQAGETLRSLLDEWKEAQRRGPRIDKASEDLLWKRFSHARATFDRGRRQFFAEQEHRRAEAKATKEELIGIAERLATSTDWGATAGEFRTLMERWKAAGRAAAREDDALWERFRAAQDAFFAARQAAGTATDEEYGANLRAKLALVEEAEALVPVKDLGRTRAALRSIQDRWEAVGKVPRADVSRVEGRLRAVEQAVKDAQQQAWTRRNPEVRSRAEGAVAQLEASIAALEADLEAAREHGDARTVKAAKDALAARKAWLAQVRRTADEIR